jgi:diketogulonate reductase-like aldo/keto reductase
MSRCGGAPKSFFVPAAIQKPWIVPIPGMDKVEYIDDNLKSIDLELTAEDLHEIDNELSKINVQGARLDEGLLSMSED